MVSKSKLEWLVIHSTETEFGLSISLSEINSNHKERFGIIGFSDVIDFEGSIKATYDFYDYKKTKPYVWGLKNSRHIAYVGGLSEDGFYKEDTKSPEQQETLEDYISIALNSITPDGLEKLKNYRKNLRSKIIGSSLFDVQNFSNNFANKLNKIEN